ncbi:MAG: photosystem I reaction center subunit XI [Cyanobacteria bacterium]|nr:photosystem I reaction center subunit XI [Cyanobacteriota bacterium]
MAGPTSPGGNPQVGDLETPLNSSQLTKAFIGNLPAYRPELAPQRRGLEVGMAHGYFVYGPFALLGPLRDSDIPGLAGLLGAVGLVMILAMALSLYATAGVSDAVAKATAPFTPPTDFHTASGWRQFANGFLIGGLGGAIVAYLVASLAAMVLG